MPAVRHAAALAAALLASFVPAAARAAPAPLVGVNLSNYGGWGCRIDGAGIVATYDRPGVRERVQHDLRVMRARGIESVRLLLWYASRPAPQEFGIVPAPGGALPEPYLTNLAEYVSDVRDAGFRQLTLSFAPELANDPGLVLYDPRLFADDWALIRQVRALVVQDGPPSVHFDLLNEGAPNPDGTAWLARERAAYLVRLYRLYVRTYGRADVVISAIAGRFPRDDARLAALLRVFARSGVGYPEWFEIHLGYRGADTLAGLRHVDAVLRARGLQQPLVIGEAPYDSPATARAIATFARTSTRPVREVLEWPLARSRPCPAISVAPPYRATAYQRALR